MRAQSATGRWQSAISRPPIASSHAPCSHPKTRSTLATESAAKKFCRQAAGRKWCTRKPPSASVSTSSNGPGLDVEQPDRGDDQRELARRSTPSRTSRGAASSARSWSPVGRGRPVAGIEADRRGADQRGHWDTPMPMSFSNGSEPPKARPRRHAAPRSRHRRATLAFGFTLHTPREIAAHRRNLEHAAGAAQRPEVGQRLGNEPHLLAAHDGNERRRDRYRDRLNGE